MASANRTTYYYDVHGNRVQKAGSKWYWYGLGKKRDESDTHGNITDEYVYFGGKRVAHRVVSTNALYFYGDDMLGTSRAIFTSAGVLCYDADFYPYGLTPAHRQHLLPKLQIHRQRTRRRIRPRQFRG